MRFKMKSALHLYNALWTPVKGFLRLSSRPGSKTRRALEGRRAAYPRLQRELQAGKPVCWLHAASLGEYEMGLPVLDEFARRHPDYQIVVTFFSPSGYEVVSRRPSPHIYVYLPWDQWGPMRDFIGLLNPRVALFVKYEIWPICLEVLAGKGIPAFLISALFRPGQAFFRWYGAPMRRALRTFSHIFTQNEDSLELLRGIGIDQASIGGDTRFERVSQTLKDLEPLPYVEQFKEGSTLCLVAGSTWPEDERILLEWLPSQPPGLKLVLAPHEVDVAHIDRIREEVSLPFLAYTSLDEMDASVRKERLRIARVLIVDTIGLLRKMYRYAEVSFVGGGFSGKLHNTLEPAVFGIPIVIGPHFSKFPEAIEMQQRKGLFPVGDTHQLRELMRRFLSESDYREESGRRNEEFVRENLGATQKIADFIDDILK